jgi:hypothetical protein
MLARRRLYHSTRCLLTDNNNPSANTILFIPPNPTNPEPSSFPSNPSINPASHPVSLLISTIPKVPFRIWTPPTNKKNKADESNKKEIYRRVFKNNKRIDMEAKFKKGWPIQPPIPNKGKNTLTLSHYYTIINT